jgi:hypothetical protein
MAYGEFAGQGDDTSEGTETVGGMRQGKTEADPSASLRDDNEQGAAEWQQRFAAGWQPKRVGSKAWR